MSIVPVYILSPYNVFLYFSKGKVHKDGKLGIMTNIGKSSLAKVIFTEFGILLKCRETFEKFIAAWISSKNTGLPQFISKVFGNCI